MVGEGAVVEPVLPVVRGPDEPVVGLLVVCGAGCSDHESAAKRRVALLHQRPGRGARALEAHVHVGGDAQLDVAVLGAAVGLVVARARVLPRAHLAPVVEQRLAVERHLDLAVHAADQPQQHVVGVVVRRRAAVRVRAILLVVPGPDQEHVAHDDPAAASCPSSSRAPSCRAGSGARRAPRRRPARAGTRRRRGRGSPRTRSASRSAAGRATRRCRSAPRARRSRSRTGSRTRRSAGTGSP